MYDQDDLKYKARIAKQQLEDYYRGAIYGGEFEFLNLEIAEVERLYKNGEYEKIIEKAIDKDILK